MDHLLKSEDFIKPDMDLHAFFCWQSTTCDLHRHDFYELAYVYEGEGLHICRGEKIRVSAGTIVLLSPGAVHDFVSYEDRLLFIGNLLIRQDYMHKVLQKIKPLADKGLLSVYSGLSQPNKPFYHLFRPKDPTYYRNQFWTITHEYNHYTSLSGELMEYALQILLLSLMREYEYGKAGTFNPLTGNSDVDDILTYLNTHYHDPISLKRLSAEFGLSREYLCRYFKKVTGQTIGSYLSSVRMEHARSLLITTNYPVGDIAERCGYPTAANFLKAFKKMHRVSPSAYRALRR
ncbi:MAG: AraC family transcriptional regulator [Lachnospiraceae bacterium]|nr:AraC family transcriptional regulator [Lachnospiraceae bacterium]